MRTLATRLLLGALLALVGAVGIAVPAQAQDDAPDAGANPADGATVDVIEVTGLIDPVVVSFVLEALDEAESSGSVALVLQLDSPGAVVDDDRYQELVDRLASSDVTVATWVGPAGSQAGDLGCDDPPGDAPCGAAGLVAVADVAGMAGNTRLATPSGRVAPALALDRGLVDFATVEGSDPDAGSGTGGAAVLGDFIVNVPGVDSREIEVGDETRREPITPTRFASLPLTGELLHTVSSPPVAYLLFVLGMALLLFELFTAGVGVAGAVGAISFILGGYGLAVLPTSGIAVALLVLAMFGFGVDIQTGVPQVWTAIAAGCFLVGSLTLYDEGVALSWVTLVVVGLGVALAMLAGMPAMVRTRFSTPTIGREWMLGEEGEARGAIDPDGVVVVRGAPWKARTNRATPVAAGAQVRVSAIDGLVLEVEPLEGAARDHRDRRRSAPSDDDA